LPRPFVSGGFPNVSLTLPRIASVARSAVRIVGKYAVRRFVLR
jgi:hypothetical protein